MNKFFLTVFLIVVFSGCDVQIPDKWESPTWHFPITIPLIDKTYFLSEISSATNQIQIDSLNKTFIISIDTTLLDSGEIVIEESYFQVPSLASISDNFSFIVPSSSIPDIDSQSFTLSIQDLTSDNSITSDCLPYQSTELMDIEFQTDEMPTYEDVSVDYVTQIHDVSISDGEIIMSITNDFPFIINQVILNFYDASIGSIWKNKNIYAILPGETRESQILLIDDSIPKRISVNTDVMVDSEVPDANPNECNVYIVIDGINDPNFCNFSGGFWIDDQCLSDTGENGWVIDGSEYLDVSIDFNLNSLHSLTVDMEYVKDTTIVQEFNVADGISLIEAEFYNTQALDTNKVLFNLDNNLFTSLNMDIEIDQIFNPDGSKYEKSIMIPQGGMYIDNDDLSGTTIKNEDGQIVDEIYVKNQINFSGTNQTILFDTDYYFNINFVAISSLQFNELSVELDQFSTPEIDMANMPAGLDGIGLPTLEFHIDLYNQISAPLTLVLDIMGITNLDTTTIHAEPKLRYPENFTGIDSSIIDIFSDTLLITGQDYEEVYILDAPISSLFSKDEIQVSGYAILDGDATLEPGKSFWGDIQIAINPLTIVLDNNSVLIPQENTLIELDESTKESIKNTLVKGEIFLEATNNMPVGADLNLLASNNQFFPLCYDSLITGSLINQIVSDSCIQLIQSSLLPDSIFVELNEDSTIYYAKFINSTDTTLIGKLMSLNLYAPQSLDENGFVVEGVVNNDFVELDSLALSWLTGYETLYLSPMITNLTTSVDSLPGWITFHTVDNLKIRSYISLMINSDGIIKSDE